MAPDFAGAGDSRLQHMACPKLATVTRPGAGSFPSLCSPSLPLHSGLGHG